MDGRSPQPSPSPQGRKWKGRGRREGTGSDNPAKALQKPDIGESSSLKRALTIRVPEMRPAQRKQDAP